MSDNKSFPEINGLLSGLRTFDTPVRQTPAPTPVSESDSPANNIISESPPVIGSSEQNTLWEEFMHNLRECPARCRKPDRLSYFIDKDIADSISECNIEKRSNSDIINAILRTFLSLNLEQFNMYRQESKTLFNTRKPQQ